MFISLRKKFGYSLRAKRWVGFLFIGFITMCLGFIFFALSLILLAPGSFETIRSFDPFALAFTGFTALLISSYWFCKGLKAAFISMDRKDQGLFERLREFVFHRSNKAENKYSIVALGGGTGLSSLLKGIKELPVNLHAIVTVTDDGGSSGRLRKELQILPPGDIRNCLVALSRSESLLSQLFQYRFSEGGDIEGHSFGNLFIAAITGVLGDFGSAVREASNILAIKGQVIPVTNENVQLAARFKDETEIVGETAISAAQKVISSIKLKPEFPAPNPEAISSIEDANMIILGPGSLYTSVIPNLLVPGISDAINQAKGVVVYICNVMTQPGETDSFTAADHVQAILDKTNLKKIDIVVVNSRRAAKPIVAKYETQGQYWVPPTVKKIEDMCIRVIASDLLLESNMVRHNPSLLASTIMKIIGEQPKDEQPHAELIDIIENESY